LDEEIASVATKARRSSLAEFVEKEGLVTVPEGEFWS
jgi:hypothetical protein